MSTTLDTSKQRATSTPTPKTAHVGGSAVAQLKSALRGGGGYEAQAAMLAPRSGSKLAAPLQAKMESAFGADFSNVRVHQGGQAEAIGAKAFATGNDVHFASGAYQPQSQSGQELIGHELAHVVQQRQGRVAPTMQAKGGMGVNTDNSLEHEADVLGAKAARGERVRGGRGGGGGSSARPGVVQGLFVVSPAQALTAFGHDFGGIDMRVADDGTLAAPAGEDVKHFYATKSHIKSSNKILEGAKSQFRLSAEGGSAVEVRGSNNSKVTLEKVVGEAPSRNERGGDLSGGPNCNQMAGEVMGRGKVRGKKKGTNKDKEAVRQVKGTSMSITESDNTGMDLHRYITELARGEKSKKAESNVMDYNDQRGLRPQVKSKNEAHLFTITYATLKVPSDERKDQPFNRVADLLMRYAGENRNAIVYNLGKDSASAKVRTAKAGTFDADLRALEDDMRKGRQDAIATIVDTGATEQVEFGEIDNSQAENEDTQALLDYDNLNKVDREKALKKAGMNTHASPEVGEAFGIQAAKDPSKNEDVPFPYHWAGVVAKSGSDTVTLENYAGRTGDDVYFTMYGPQTQVTITANKVKKATNQGSQDDKDSTTFHGQWEKTFPGVHTITHSTKMVESK